MKKVTEAIVLVVYLAIIFTLVRPNSQGPTLITSFGNAFASILGKATGGGSFNA